MNRPFGPSCILLAAGTSWYLWNFRRKVITALAENGMNVFVAAPKDEYSERLAELPRVRWLDWPLAMDGTTPVQEFSSLRRYARIVRQSEPDFVINHGIKANIYGGLTCRRLSIPYANSVTGLGAILAQRGFTASALRKLYLFACARSKPLFIQNYDDLAALRAMGLCKDVPIIRTMGSGVDLEHFAFAPMPSGVNRTFLFIGRLQRGKGIADFVQAAGAVRKECPQARFMVVGSSQFTNSGALSGETLEKWKAEGTVEFVGHQEDVRKWLAKANVLVLPSRGEGMPRAILEAAATGRPSIATDVSGCRDAVIAGETGYLVPADDVPALVNAMRRVCETTDEELATMGKAARADAEARFSDARLIEATLAVVSKF